MNHQNSAQLGGALQSLLHPDQQNYMNGGAGLLGQVAGYGLRAGMFYQKTVIDEMREDVKDYLKDWNK